MFLGLSQTSKSRKFTTKRDKGSIKAANTDVHNTSVPGNTSSIVVDASGSGMRSVKKCKEFFWEFVNFISFSKVDYGCST